MIYRKLTPSGDYTFGLNAQGFYSSADAVKQAIFTSLKLFEGEWWEDQSQGFPLVQNILGVIVTPKNQQGVDAIVQKAISNVQGVQSIENFTSTFAKGRYQFSCDVVTIYGQVGFTEVSFL